MITYSNDGKCRDNSWTATLDREHSSWSGYSQLLSVGYGVTQMEAHECLRIQLQNISAYVYKAVAETEIPTKETSDELGALFGIGN